MHFKFYFVYGIVCLHEPPVHTLFKLPRFNFVSLVASPPLLKYLPKPLVGNPIIKILDTPLVRIGMYYRDPYFDSLHIRSKLTGAHDEASFVTIFGKIDHLHASTEVHFLPVHERYIHALFRNIKH